MSMVKGQLLIFLTIYICKSSGVTDAPHDAAKKVRGFYLAVDESNLICSSELTTFGQLFGDDAKVYVKITDPMYEIRVALHEIENSINSKMKDILVKIVRPTVMAYRSVDTMEIFISTIAADYRTFDQMILQYGYMPDHSLGNLTTSIFSGIEANIGIIRKIMTDPKEMLPGKSNLIAAISDYAKKNGPKKLQYLNSTILGFSGNRSKCPENDAYIIDTGKVSNSEYATCGCQCHENHNKISLMVMGSEVYSNEVIIGLRFKRSNGTLHIQPRVGKLITHGQIERYSERWIKMPNDIDTSLIHSAGTKDSIFFLDDVLLPPKFVLTGVRFVEVRRGTVTGLAIETFGVSFDFRSGELDHNRKIQSSSSRDNPGLPLPIVAKRPPQTTKLNTVISTDMKYVQLKQPLTRSDFKQSMLPLFDAIPVTTDPPIALGGIGIFHKSVELYAGFIALRTYGMSYAPYFENSTSAHEFESRVQLFT